MGRRIKHLLLFIFVIISLLGLGGCGNTLLEVVESKVAAATAITVNFEYTGAFEISDNFPVIFRFYPNPFSGDPETDEKIKDIKLTKQGTELIPDSAFFPTDSRKYFVVMFHDLNNNGVEDSIEDDALYVNNGETNIMYDFSDEYVIEREDDPFYINFTDDVLMSIGGSYSITFADEQDYIDEWEADDTYSSTSCDELTPGTSRTHWLGWEDTDYIKLSPASDGNYTVEIFEFDSNNPVLDISIMVEQGGGLYHVLSDYDVSTFPSPLSADMTISGGDQYFLRLKNPSSQDHGIGNYIVNFSGPN